MEPYSARRVCWFSPYEKLVAIVLALLAVVSPLYIDRKSIAEPEPEEEPFDFASLLPPLLLVLALAILLSLYLDWSLTKFDPNWIHRVSGSSVGILAILVILVLVLRLKAWMKSSDD